MNPVLSHPVLSAPARLHLEGGASVATRGVWSRRPSAEGDLEAPTALSVHCPSPETGDRVMQVSDPATSRLYEVLSHDEAESAIGSRVEWRSSLYHLRSLERVFAPERAIYTAAAEEREATQTTFLEGESRSFLASPVSWARFAGTRYALIAAPRSLGSLSSVRIPGDPLEQVAVFERQEPDVPVWGVPCRVWASRWEVFSTALAGGRAEVSFR